MSQVVESTILEIVADGGTDAGFGHLGRCLAIAEALGSGVSFAVDGSAAEFVTRRGGSVGARPDAPVVLLDRRRPTAAGEVRSLKATARRVVLLDDMGSGRDHADLLIDPPTASRWPETNTPRLAGFEHVLLRREVRRARRANPSGVLLAMGGSDPSGATGPLATALHAAGIEVTANLGPGYAAALPASVPVLSNPSCFVGALAGTALLVASYGHTLLEAAHLGVPAIAVVLRHEHREHAEAFCYNGTAMMLDMSRTLDPAALIALVSELLSSDTLRSELGQRGRELVDGHGTDRVAAAIQALV